MRYMQRSLAVRNAIFFSGVLAFAAIVALAMDALGTSKEFLAALPLCIVVAGVVCTVPAVRNRLRRLCGLDPI